MDVFVQILPIIAIAVIFWLLIIRPNVKRQRQQLEMQAAIEVGNEVMLTSGIFGVVSEEAEGHLMIEVAPDVLIKVVRGAVATVVVPSDQSADEPVDESTPNDGEA